MCKCYELFDGVLYLFNNYFTQLLNHEFGPLRIDSKLNHSGVWSKDYTLLFCFKLVLQGIWFIINHMKILITGSAGFIGYHATLFFLENGHEVFGIDILNDYYDPELKKKRNSILLKNQNYHFF